MQVIYKDFSVARDLHCNRQLFWLFKSNPRSFQVVITQESSVTQTDKFYQQQWPYFNPLDRWERAMNRVLLPHAMCCSPTRGCSKHRLSWGLAVSHHQLAEAPCTAVSPDGARMPVGAGPCSSPGFASLTTAGAGRWVGIPQGCWRGGSVNIGWTDLFLCLLNTAILVFFLSVTCALGYLMGHFMSQGMSLRHITLQDEQAAVVFLLPFLHQKSYNQGARRTSSLPAFPVLVTQFCAFLTCSSMTLLWQQPPQRKQPPPPAPSCCSSCVVCTGYLFAESLL